MALACLAAPAKFQSVQSVHEGAQLEAWSSQGPGALVLVDRGDPGALFVLENGVVLDFGGQHLRGTAAGDGARAPGAPDTYRGVGLVVRAKNVTLKNLRVSGFQVGVLAEGADGLTLENIDVSDNFRQRLGSTTEREDASDWLWPHANDQGEWLERYGAGIAVRDASGVRIADCRARDGQNGLILERVRRSVVHDCDFSFLSGWGIALWRSSDNLLARNALDFCIRGYSHDVYNRGQDSAGLLFFEQCSRNLVAYNSATHGGDGFFGFAGHAALGEHAGEVSDEELARYERLGNNDNLLYRNDFSYAAAHGLELTFSFGNQIVENRFVENAICGIWGGYSKESWIADNVFEENGQRGYGLERGGIAIEHGCDNWIVRNTFRGNALGVRLWWDPDEGLMQKPWARTNGGEVRDNVVAHNRFEAGDTLFESEGDEGTVWVANQVGSELTQDRGSTANGVDLNLSSLVAEQVARRLALAGLEPEPQAESPLGARSELAGRENILVGEWGPWSHSGPWATRSSGPRGDRWELEGVSTWELLESSEDDDVLVALPASGELLVLPIELLTARDVSTGPVLARAARGAHSADDRRGARRLAAYRALRARRARGAFVLHRAALSPRWRWPSGGRAWSAGSRRPAR